MKKLITSVLVLSGLFMCVHNSRAQVNYNLVCVDSVWYEPGNPLFINVSIYNGDTLSMNYPSVQIVSPANDTIGNPSNFVNYFAHGANSFQTYTDTITQSGILDFSSYTFLMSEGFGDTTVIINWCVPVSVGELQKTTLNIFPNPAADVLHISGSEITGTLKIYNAFGNLILSPSIAADAQHPLTIDVSRLANGIYFMLLGDKKVFYAKFLKQ
jgi:hypothetical protein